MILLLASLFFTSPAPLDMPRAEGWLVRDDGRIRFEDRYSVGDLWYSRAVTGYWLEDDGARGFLFGELDFLPPAVSGMATRTDYERTLVRSDRRDDRQLLLQLQAVSPVPVTEEYARPRQLPRGMKSVRYYEGTNLHHLVCAYLPERSDHWSFAIWELAEGDDREERRKVFEDGFWEEVGKFGARDKEQEKPAGLRGRSRKSVALSERDLLKRDARHSVSAYDNWHVIPGEDFVILDDLSDAREFVVSLTNDLAVWRGRFALALPPAVDTANTLSVARIYRNRADFLVAAGEGLQWAAAYWNPSRRELVACLAPDGDLAQLKKTFRHEAFHQYLAYATAMMPTSPWLNEGYAQYFEDEESDTFDLSLTEEQWDEAELAIPALLRMDYRRFYAGTDAQRRTNYRLAWSVVYFIEHGMRDIRHDPFRDLKRIYLETHSRTGDMHQATAEAFGSDERLKLFCNEWKKFWKNRH